VTRQTPGDELRAAATRLRTLANAAAHDGRHTWTTANTLGSKSPVVVDDEQTPSVLIESFASRLEDVNRYIAALDPKAGLLLADLLESVSCDADDSALDDPGSERHDACDKTVCAPSAALALARILNALETKEPTT